MPRLLNHQFLIIGLIICLVIVSLTGIGPITAFARQEKIVVIDPGHGGNDTAVRMGTRFVKKT